MISRKFQVAKSELERLSLKIHIQKGSWLFRKHVYSVEELLESEHYNKIYAVCEKIGDDVYNWYLNDKLSEEGRETYEKEREGIRRKLVALHKDIQDRKPTGWENFLSIFEGFVVIVMKVIPTFAKIVKMVANYLEVDVSKLLSSGKSPKLLPKPTSDEKQA